MSGVPSTMVVHVGERGKDMPGLMKYLYGGGKTDEHTNQRMVASSPGLAMAYQGALSPAEARDLGRVVESSWRAQLVPQLAIANASGGGVSSEVLKDGSVFGGVRDFDREHVYHLIVSLPPGEGWTDDQWATVAEDLVRGMGFTDGPEDDQGCRWVAVHHGLSAGGNDHLHIAVNLIRQDGRRAALPRNDFAEANRVREQIEKEHDFVLPLRDRGQSSSLPAYHQAEHQRAQRMSGERGHSIPDRVMLQQVVRGAATTSNTEAEWIDTVLEGHPGVQLEPSRRDAVTGDVVGYRVRLGDEGLWFNSSDLARDLTLGKLRPMWAAAETEESRQLARDLWNGNVEPVAAAADQPINVEQHLTAAVDELQQWNTELEHLPPTDADAWKREVGTAAGTVSLLGAGTPGPMGEDFTIAARDLTRHATSQTQPPAVSRSTTTLRGPSRGELAARQVQLALRASSPSDHQGWLAVLQQLNRSMKALHAAQEARGELAAARQMHANVVSLLADTHTQAAALLDPEQARIREVRGYNNASTNDRTLTRPAPAGTETSQAAHPRRENSKNDGRSR